MTVEAFNMHSRGERAERARVRRMCMASKSPLESGGLGFNKLLDTMSDLSYSGQSIPTSAREAAR